jgi:hypothetical protein
MTGERNQSNEDGQIAVQCTVLGFAGTSLVFSMGRVWQEFVHPILVWPLGIETVPLSVDHCFGCVSYE